MAEDVTLSAADAQVAAPGSGTLYLILIQVASRALTFIGNQFLLRFLSPQLLGISVQLELFSVSVLYFSRESLRVALQRQPPIVGAGQNDDRKTSGTGLQSQIIVNLSSLAITLGLVLTGVLGYSYSVQADTEVLDSPYFQTSLLIYAVATGIELLSEPSFVVLQQNSMYKERAKAETRAAVLKCLAACMTAVYGYRAAWKPSVLPFAVGQCCYALVLLFYYAQAVHPLATRDNFSLTPTTTRSSSSSSSSSTDLYLSRFSKPLLNLALTLYGQSLFKQLLTQGDALILSLLASLSSQGAFALASAYGGLLARLVFQPIEESSRTAFGKLLAPSPTKSNLAASKAHLTAILRLYALLSLLSWSYLPVLLPLAVRAITGPTFFTPSTSTLLATYAHAIPFLAYNGILDAFVTSVATPAELAAQSAWMAAFTAAYLASAWVLLIVLGLGAQGLVLANIANMACRIMWSVFFIKRYLNMAGEEMVYHGTMPRPGSIAASVATGAVVRAWPDGRPFLGQMGVVAMLPQLGICGVGGLCITLKSLFYYASLFFERDFLLEHASTLLPQRLASKLKR